MKKALRPAFTATIPVLCGYLFIGFAFGVMLRDIGFGSIWSFFCSLTIYAGSGQYLLVSLLAAKASLVTVAVMTLLLNCRHIFYGLSLLCSVKTPEGIDAGDMRFWIAMLDHSYWILGGVLGTIIGGILPFDTTGIDFAMTSLFTVIFVEQWQSTKCHIPALMGLAAAAVSLAILGPDNFILPAMLAICVMLVAMRGRLAKEVA